MQFVQVHFLAKVPWSPGINFEMEDDGAGVDMLLSQRSSPFPKPPSVTEHHLAFKWNGQILNPWAVGNSPFPKPPRMAWLVQEPPAREAALVVSGFAKLLNGIKASTR